MNARLALVLLSGAVALDVPAYGAVPVRGNGSPAVTVNSVPSTYPYAPALAPKPVNAPIAASAAVLAEHAACGSSCPPQGCGQGASCSPACPSPCGSAASSCTCMELDAEVILWWTKSISPPPLATTSIPADLGVLGMPSTVAVIGNDRVDFGERVGGKFGGRFFIENGWGISAGGFFLENGSHRQGAAGLPVLAIPTINPDSGANEAVRLAGPGAAIGSASLEMGSRFWGADTNVIYRFDDSPEWKVDGFCGFRFLSLNETLKLYSSTTMAGPGLFSGLVTPPGSTYSGQDSFGARNSFYGGQVGTRVQARVVDRLFVVTQAQVALGGVNQRLGIEGGTILTAPGLVVPPAAGNVYTQQSNIGRFTRTRFAVVPEVAFSIGYELTENILLKVGYDFLYCSSVIRAADQIDRRVNPNFPPIQDNGVRTGTSAPTPQLNSTDYWAQGLSLGLQFAF